jgi:type I restriction enzyme S subunit
MDTKKLRQKILDLAIRGKLVPQDSNDEPASMLVEKIRAEKERLIKEKKIKRDKNESVIFRGDDKSPYRKFADGTVKCIDGEVPFEVPEGWEWCRLGDIGETVTGNTPSKEHEEFYGNDYPFYKPTDLEQGIFVEKANDNLSLIGYEKARKLPAQSILVTCIGATIGKTGLIIKEGTCNQQINAIIPYNSMSKYLYFCCIADFFQNQIKNNASATTLPIINKSKFEQLYLPLPPLSEQHRIVSEIERVFAQIDKIEENKLSLEQFVKQAKSKVLDLALYHRFSCIFSSLNSRRSDRNKFEFFIL